MLEIIFLATLGAWAISVVTLVVGFTESFRIDSDDSWLYLESCEGVVNMASRRSACVCLCRVVWHPDAHLRYV